MEIFEPVTEDFDRGRKAAWYRMVPSLREFLLIGVDPVFVEQNRRMADGTWQVILHQENDAVIKLRSIGVELPVSVIYEHLEWY